MSIGSNVAALGTDAEPVGSRQMIARLYWCGVFGELYGGTTETRFARDLPDLISWVRDAGDEPRTVQEASSSPAGCGGVRR